VIDRAAPSHCTTPSRGLSQCSEQNISDNSDNNKPASCVVYRMRQLSRSQAAMASVTQRLPCDRRPNARSYTVASRTSQWFGRIDSPAGGGACVYTND
jgi:hypothetical protein